MSYLTLCFQDLPDDLKRFHHYEIAFHDGEYVLRFYYEDGSIRCIVPSLCRGLFGDFDYIIPNFSYLFGGMLYEKKKTLSTNKSKKLSRRRRNQASELGSSSDAWRNSSLR